MLKDAVFGTAALASAATGCAATPTATVPREPWSGHLDPRAADELLASIDKRLAWIDRQTLPDHVVPLSKLAKTEEASQDLAAKTALTRKAMRALYVTGRFADLPDELKAHPGVQARLAAIQPDMDDAVLGMTALLEAMTAEDHRRMQRHLRNDPGLGERIARYVERPALEDGVPFRRRMGVRAGILQLTDRMRAQSPALVTEPLVRKVRRIEARPQAGAEQARMIASRIGEQAFWDHQEKIAAIHEAWLAKLGPEGTMAATAPVVAAPGPAATPAAAAAPATEKQGDKTVRTGAIIMGFGAGSVLAGLLFWGIAEATASDGLLIPAIVLGVTVGPILLIVGLITVIVGAGMSA